jgi:polysaccharide pyruvyl transferase CsaB
VFLVGYYGFANLGDEAIRTAIERAAPAHGAEVVHFASRGPSNDPRAVPVRGPAVWRYLRAIWRADRVVLGGGGILKDEGLWLPAELFVTALVARLLRRPVTLLAVGVGPFYRPLGRALVAATARLATPRTVRDGVSGEALGRLGIHDWVLGADPVFSMPPARSTSPARVGEPGPARRPRAVVAIRPWFLGGDAVNEPRRRAFRGAVGEAVAALVGAGWEVDLVALHWPRDRDEARRLLDQIGPGVVADAVRLTDGPLDWDGLAALVGCADLVIAMRYHALAAAAIAARPVIALAYEPKVAALAEELGVLAIAVGDPDLALRLVAAVRGVTGTGVAEGTRQTATQAPDARHVAALRERAGTALRLALSPATRARPD